MADWRDDLRDCTFRGVACHYRRASTQRGRRLAVHQYPGRDIGDVEDLGRRNRKFSLDLYLLDSTAPGTLNTRRDALVAALERGGAGTLVHPHYGAISVHVERVRESYSTREGGQVRLSVEFVEAAAERAPTSATDTAVVLGTRTDALAGAAQDSFCVLFSPLGWPEFVRDSARTIVDAAAAAMDLAGAVSGLIDDVTALADRLFGGRETLAAAGLTRIRSVRDFGEDLDAFGATTPSQRQQNTNQTAVITLVRYVTLCAALDHVTETDFVSYDDGIAQRDELLAQIDDLALVAPDDVYNALIAARGALIEDVAQRAGPLARLRPYTPNATVPALALAWLLYAEPGRGTDVAARNTIMNPCFVPGGEPLEVLDA